MENQEPVLAKLSHPRMPRIIARERLFARLQAMRELPMVWVSGPPGAGKSALLSSHLDLSGRAHLWYRVDAADGDVLGCLRLLEGAAQLSLGSDLPLTAAAAEATSDAAAFTRGFFRRFFTACAPGFALVLDGLERAPELAPLLRDALDEIPAGMSIMVASRTAPPPTLARQVAHGQVGCLDWEALRFTAEEAAEVAAAHGVADQGAASALAESCEGWAAGLEILLRKHAAGQRVASLDASELLHDYFASELFEPAPESLRSALLATAALPAFTPAMVSQLVSDDVSAVVGALRHRNFFISQHGGSGWLRYHGLFRAFLLARLGRDLPPEQSREIRRRCARLLADAGQVDDAVELYAHIGDSGELKGLVAAHAGALARDGQWERLGRWLALVPAAHVQGDAWLTYWQANLLLSASPAAAQAQFQHAYRQFELQRDQRGQFLAAVGAIEAIFARVDTYQALDEWILVLEPSMQRAHEVSEPADLSRAWYAFLQAALLRRPDHPLVPMGIAWLREGLSARRFSPAEMVSAGAILLFYGCIAADEETVRETVAATAEAAHRDDVPAVPRWSWHYWHGLFWLWRLEYDHAVACWQHCSRISEQCGLASLDWLVHGNLVMVDLAEDRLEKAEWRLARLRQAGSEGHTNAYTLYWMGETFLRLYRRRGDLLEAIRAMVECARRTGFFNLEMLCLSDAAAVHMLRDEDGTAAALIEEVAARVAGTVVRQSDGQVMALRAGLEYRAGQTERARRTFERALELVARGGTCGCMLWVRAGLSSLFGEALRVNRHAPLVRDLVRRYEVPAPPRAGSEWPWPVRIRALGELQIEVDDTPVPFRRKAQQKVLELLKALIAAGGKEVDGGLIADWLWPDVEGDAGQSNLRGTVKRLRELLGHPEAVRLFDGKLSLNERLCWLDVWAFREWCLALLEDGRPAGQHAEPSRHLQSLYRGPLLNGEEMPWLQAARRRERLRMSRVLARLSACDQPAAERLRDHALVVDPELTAA